MGNVLTGADLYSALCTINNKMFSCLGGYLLICELKHDYVKVVIQRLSEQRNHAKHMLVLLF